MTVQSIHHPAQCRTAPAPHLRGPLQSAFITLLTMLLMALPFAASAQSADADGDGVIDDRDNCVQAYNPDQHDDDQDLYGDVCDPDLNNDGSVDLLDIAEFKRLMGTGDLEPDLSGDGQVDYRDLGLLKSMLGSMPGPRGVTAAELDPIYTYDSPNVVPIVAEIDGIDGGAPRTIGRIQDSNGHLDVVTSELILISENPSDATDLMNRWGGTLMASFDPNANTGIAGPTVYLIEIPPAIVEEADIIAGLNQIAPQIHGGLTGDGDDLGALLGVIVEERVVHGLNVSFNSLMPRNAFIDRTTTESDIAFASLPVSYSDDAYEWATIERDPDIAGDSYWPNDTRVGEAWRVMDMAGLLNRTSRAMIWDGGFWPNADFPPFSSFGAMRSPNTDPTGCGSGSVAPFGSTCEAHGTHVVEAGFGIPDNAFGVAGPGGPVADLGLLSSPEIDVFAILRFITSTMPAALSERPDVINISAGFEIPAGWCVLACPPLNLMTQVLTNAGSLIVAAGGNQNRDVDQQDSFCIVSACVSFEAFTYAPCELDGVLCVGATQHEESYRASYSNWGTATDANSIDIFAPGDLFSVIARNADSNATEIYDTVQMVNGTSFATPFVSGVATLVNSAQPALNAHQIADCILRSAHTESGSFLVNKRINAVGAVSCARDGRTHPFVEIVNPVASTSVQQGIELLTLRADAHDYEQGAGISIRWTSNVDGFLMNTTPGEIINIPTLNLTRGTHHISALVLDRTGLSHSDTVSIEVTNPLPILTLLAPSGPGSYYVGSPITFTGSSLDPNETPMNGPLDDSQVRWLVNGSQVGTGHSFIWTPTTNGPRNICFAGTDDDGEDGTPDCTSIWVDSVPTNTPPVVTFTSPTAGTSYNYDGTPISVPLAWTTTDAEDGTIPFSQHNFSISKNGGPFTDVTGDIESFTYCSQPEPAPIFCSGFTTTFSLDIEPLGTTSTTNVVLRATATDSGAQTSSPATTNITIFNLF